jgi:hypothetical protein
VDHRNAGVTRSDELLDEGDAGLGAAWSLVATEAAHGRRGAAQELALGRRLANLVRSRLMRQQAP